MRRVTILLFTVNIFTQTINKLVSTIGPRLQFTGCFLRFQHKSTKFACTVSQQVFQVTHKLVHKPKQTSFLSDKDMLRYPNSIIREAVSLVPVYDHSSTSLWYLTINYSMTARWVWVGYNHLISNKREWNNKLFY